MRGYSLASATAGMAALFASRAMAQVDPIVIKVCAMRLSKVALLGSDSVHPGFQILLRGERNTIVCIPRARLVLDVVFFCSVFADPFALSTAS